MNREILKAVYQVLINLSYTLFAMGVLLNIYAAIDNGEPLTIFLYVTDPARSIFLGMLILLALVIAAIFSTFQQSKKLAAQTKRGYDLVVDVLRAVLYICLLFFFKGLAFDDPEEALILGSFWSLVLASALFAIRKIMKWVQFLLYERDNFSPWENDRLAGL